MGGGLDPFLGQRPQVGDTGARPPTRAPRSRAPWMLAHTLLFITATLLPPPHPQGQVPPSQEGPLPADL